MPKHFNPEGERLFFELMLQGVYEIDGDGKIWKLRNRSTGRDCRKRAEKAVKPDWYMQVHFYCNGRHWQPSAHRLVYIHHKGPIPVGITINHDDGKKQNNKPSNLLLANDSDQMQHAVHALGTARAANQWGEDNHAVKLTDEQVEEVRKRYATGTETFEKLGAEFGVSFQHISSLIRGYRRSKQGGKVFDRDLRHAAEAYRDPRTGRMTSKIQSGAPK